MRSPNRRFPRLTAVAILSMAMLTVASSRAAPPPAAPPPAAIPPAAPTPIAQGDVGGQRPRASRPVATIDGRLPRPPAPRPVPALPRKPFAYHVPPSPVSPYLNLFRTDNAGGTIDNYSTLVKPAIRQRRTERLAKRNESRLDSIGAPSGRFMNYGQYFGQQRFGRR